MGIATGLTATRMQEIIDQQIVSGAVDLSGNLIMTRDDGSTFNAGAVKGAQGDPAIYQVGSFSNNAVANYVRIATIDGIASVNGGHFEFMMSGIGNITTARRGTILAHVSQRGQGVIHARVWSWGLEDLAAQSVRVFTRALGDYLFEVWVMLAPNTTASAVNVLASYRTTLNFDGKTSTAPTPLVEWIPERSDSPAASQTLAGKIEIATNAESLTNDATRAISPASLQYQSREVTVATGTTAERNSYFGTPATDAARVALANRKIVWFNTDRGWAEQYYATTGLSGLTATGLLAGTASGWYPVGDGPIIDLVTVDEQSLGPGTTFTNWTAPGTGSSWRKGGTAWFTYGSGIITTPIAGRYRLTCQLVHQPGGGMHEYIVSRNNGSGDNTIGGFARDLHATAWTRSLITADSFATAAGDNFRVKGAAGTANVGMGGNNVSRYGGEFSLAYVGPPLVSE